MMTWIIRLFLEDWVKPRSEMLDVSYYEGVRKRALAQALDLDHGLGEAIVSSIRRIVRDGPRELCSP
jgi:hypothetical protein